MQLKMQFDMPWMQLPEPHCPTNARVHAEANHYAMPGPCAHCETVHKVSGWPHGKHAPYRLKRLYGVL